MAYESRAFVIINVVAKVLGIFVVSFTYANVYASVKRHKRQIHSQEHVSAFEDKFNVNKFGKSVNTSLYILAIFLACFLPDFGVLITTKLIGLGTPSVVDFTFNLTLTILWANTTIDPIIYCYRLHKYKEQSSKFWKIVFHVRFLLFNPIRSGLFWPLLVWGGAEKALPWWFSSLIFVQL